MPHDSNIKATIKESDVLTVMPTRNNSIPWFEGNNSDPSEIQRDSFFKKRSLIQKKQHKIAKLFGGSKEIVAIISPGRQVTYKNFVDAIDEI